MENDNNPYLKDDGKARNKLRLAGWICLGIGIGSLLIGVLSFVLIGLAGGFPIVSMALFSLGGTLTMAGAVCLFLGYMKNINHYVASQGTPVVSESANYVLHDTRDEVKKTVDAVKGKEEGVVCPHCGTKNEAGAAFCDHCGAPLTKKCLSCGEINDVDSTYCRKCGGHL